MKKLYFLIVLLMVATLPYTINANSLYLKFTQALYNNVQSTYGKRAVSSVASWQKELERLKNSDVESQLYEINNFFNAVPYHTDQEHWGKSDYWATPIEVLSTNGADCEDYVIAKYFSLRSLGVPDANLRMMFVTALEYNQAHMVLAYYPQPNAVPLILDNINPRILPANKRRDLRPVYSFNGEGLWLAKAQGRGTQVGNSRHKMWDDLTARIERDF